MTVSSALEVLVLRLFEMKEKKGVTPALGVLLYMLEGVDTLLPR
jgi:hypothetical protein